jgi:hypothetical protein
MLRDVLRAISLSKLTDKQRATMKKAFEERRKALQTALAAVERGLASLSKPTKTAAKRRAKKR